jgi:integrase
LSSPKITIHKTEPGLYRHKRDGKFFGSYYAVYSHAGRRIKESLDTEVLAEARRLLRVRRAEDERLDPSLRASTLGEYCDKYWATRQGKSASTLENDQRHLQRIKAEFAGGEGRMLRTIRASEVLAFVGGLKKQSNPKEALGASDRNHFGWTLRKIFRLAVADGVIGTNPAEGLRTERQTEKLKLTPSWEQFKQIVELVRSQPQSDTREDSADLLEFYGRAGLGTAEAASLLWQDIEFDRSKIQLLRAKTGKSFVVDIYPQLRPLLEKLRQKNPNPAPNSPVFKVKAAKKALAYACRKLGFPQFSPRSFRRMFITRCLERGIDPGLVARTQGHRDGGALILKTYRHIRPAYESEMLKKLTDE